MSVNYGPFVLSVRQVGRAFYGVGVEVVKMAIEVGDHVKILSGKYIGMVGRVSAVMAAAVAESAAIVAETVASDPVTVTGTGNEAAAVDPVTETVTDAAAENLPVQDTVPVPEAMERNVSWSAPKFSSLGSACKLLFTTIKHVRRSAIENLRLWEDTDTRM